MNRIITLLKTSLYTNLLIEELQLGEKLNQCIHTNRRSDFSLMLSMLTDDVRAHSQFSLPQSEAKVHETSEDLLRKSLELPNKAPLALKDSRDINDFSQANLIAESKLASLHFENFLKPKAIAFRDDSKHIPTTVLSNTTLYCQQQHKAKDSAEHYENSRLAFNANEWLKSVQKTIVKAPLIAAYA